MEMQLPTQILQGYAEVFNSSFIQEENYEAQVTEMMPDVREILDTTGYILVRSKDCGTGSLRMNGQIAVTVLYAPDGAADAKSLHLSIPFQVNVESESIPAECQCHSALRLVQLSAIAQNPRQLHLRAEIAVQCCCWKETQREIPVAVEQEGVHMRPASVELDQICQLQEKSFALTDTYSFAGVTGEGAQLLRQQVEPVVESIGCNEGRLLLQGYLRCTLLFLSQGGQPAQAIYRTPFTQVLELEEELPADGVGRAELLLNGVFFEQGVGGQGELAVMAEYHLVAQLQYTRRCTLPYIADAYSNSRHLVLHWDMATGQCATPVFLVRGSGREMLGISGEAKQIIAVRAELGRSGVQNGEVYTGVQVHVLYTDAQGLMRGAEKQLRLTSDLPGDQKDGQLLEVVVTECAASPAAEGLELRLGVEYTLRQSSQLSWEFVSAMEWDEVEPQDHSSDPNLVIREISPACTLWELAKAGCSTVEALRVANGLEEDCTMVEGVVLIPKTL